MKSFKQFINEECLDEKNYPGQETPGMRSKAHRKQNRTASYARKLLKVARKSDALRPTLIEPKHPGQELKRQIQVDRKKRKYRPDTGTAGDFTLGATISGAASSLKTMKKMNKGNSSKKVKITPINK